MKCEGFAGDCPGVNKDVEIRKCTAKWNDAEDSYAPILCGDCYKEYTEYWILIGELAKDGLLIDF